MPRITKAILFGVILQIHQLLAYREIVGLLDNAKDLKPQEINALRPLFNELQIQYDFIANEMAHQQNDINLSQESAEVQLMIENPELQLSKYVGNLVTEEPFNGYSADLPSLNELIGNKPINNMSQAQLDEFYDIQSIMQETLDAAEQHMQALTKRSIELERQLLKISKPAILKFIYEALGTVYKYSVQARRAAYCTYSHIPQLNESLHHITDGVDCYSQATALVVRVQTETLDAVNTIKHNVVELASIYEKIASKTTLLGKIVTVMLNLNRIQRDITNTYEAGNKALDFAQNELPGAVEQSLNCATDFTANVPFVLSTVSELTTCITFVDDTTVDYEFLRPESLQLD